MGKLKRKNMHPDKLTKAQIDDLKLKDFLGQLTEDEIPIAKKNGVYKWDSYIKNRDGKRYATTLP